MQTALDADWTQRASFFAGVEPQCLLCQVQVVRSGVCGHRGSCLQLKGDELLKGLDWHVYALAFVEHGRIFVSKTIDA